jgi:hypothetical protein
VAAAVVGEKGAETMAVGRPNATVDAVVDGQKNELKREVDGFVYF